MYGLRGISHPIGTVGAAREAEAIINAVRPGTAAVTGFIPEGKGDNDIVPTFSTITVGAGSFDASTVERGIGDGSYQSVVNYLNSIGIQAGLQTIATPASPTSLVPTVVRTSGFEMVDAATKGIPYVPPVSTPTPVANSPTVQQSLTTAQVATNMATGNNSQVTGSNSILPASGSVSDLLSSPLVLGGIALVVILFMTKGK